MTHPNTTRLSTRLRLLCGLALLIGLCALTGGLTRPAHALSKLKVTTCSSDAQLQAEVAQANTDNASDVITFACSGDIKLSSTLKITGSMTLDGSGQSVTLDGGNSTQVLYVNNGVTFTLKALTIAHGVRALNALRTTTSAGGGLDNEGGTVTISNSTFSGNSADSGQGGGLFTFYGEVNIGGSIVAENTGGDCSNVDLGFGSYTDQGYNLTSDSSCGLAGTGSVQNTNPKLGPLASNGGRTQTMALLKGSPASDYIPLSSSLCPATDQRGHKRPDSPQESACDIGAYES